ncbi:MAG: NFACT family protein [Candidatus Bipolaricaulia bacterium]
MNLDGVTLKRLRDELQGIVGGTVRQVYQPERELLTAHLWRGEELTLLIAPSEGRAQLTTQRFLNPAQPSAFTMLLRKHLKGGIIMGVEQPGLERLLEFSVRRGDAECRLICEFFGRRNIVLVQDGEILGGFRQGGGERPILPHRPYRSPPSQGKLDPFSLSEGDLHRLIQGGEGELWRVLLKKIDGIGPRLARELPLRAGLEPEGAVPLGKEELKRLWHEFEELFAQVEAGRFEPVIYFDGDRPVDVAPFPLKLYEDLQGERRESLSQALDEYFGQERSLNAERERLLKGVRLALKRRERARERVREDLTKAEGYERYRRLGDLVLANLDRLKPGQREAELLDPVSGEAERVALDPKLTPTENAQALYRRYKKLKRGLEKLRAREGELAKEIEYLQGLELGLEQADGPEDLHELEVELEAGGYIKREKRRRPPVPAGPREFLIEGYKILVGRSGRQNDRLIREAKGEDLWLHARGMPGAHVVIKTGGRPGEVPEGVLERAARLAAYYSKGRGSGKVPVAFTRVKYLRRPKGAKPGLVLVQREEGTLLVPPEPEEARCSS